MAKKRDKYTNLKIKEIEWENHAPFMTVVWTVDVWREYSKSEEHMELLFPICLS